MNRGPWTWVFRFPIAALNVIVVAVMVTLVVNDAPLSGAALAIGVFLAWAFCLVFRGKLDRWTDEEYIDKSGIRGFGLAKSRAMAWSEIKSVEVVWRWVYRHPDNRDLWLPFWVRIESPTKTVWIAVDVFGGRHSVHATLAEWYGQDRIKDVKKRGYCGPKPSLAGVINAVAAVLVGLSGAALTAPLTQRFIGPGFPYGWIAGAIAGATLATHLAAFDRFNLLSAAMYLAMAAAGQIVVADGNYPYRADQTLGICAFAIIGFGLIACARFLSNKGQV